jgi:GTP-binding protein
VQEPHARAHTSGYPEPAVGTEDGELIGEAVVDETDEPLLESGGSFFGGPSSLELKLAVVGRPNVGKSSLVNRLVGANRVVVHPDAGTTRDAVSTPLTWRGLRLLVADTAGIRGQSAGGADREELGRMAVAKAKQMIMASHAALLVFDATDGLVRADMQVAHLVVEHAKSCVLLANKCDLLSEEKRAQLPGVVASRLPMLAGYAPLVTGSALTGDGASTPRIAPTLF